MTQKRNQAARFKFPAPLPKGVLARRSLLHDAFHAWLEKSRSASTRRAYGDDVKQFLEFLGANPDHLENLLGVGSEQVAAWKAHLIKSGGRTTQSSKPNQAMNSTVARKLTSLRSFYSFLQSCGYRGANPAHSQFVDAPRVEAVDDTPVPKEQIAALLKAPDIRDEEGNHVPVGIRDRAILALFAYMALRIEELARIKRGDLYREGKHLMLRIRGKANTERRGIIPAPAAKAVVKWLDITGIDCVPEESLFRPAESPRAKGRDGFKHQPMSIRAIQQIVKNSCDSAGMSQPSVRAHRITAAILSSNAGTPLADIHAWLRIG